MYSGEYVINCIYALEHTTYLSPKMMLVRKIRTINYLLLVWGAFGPLCGGILIFLYQHWRKVGVISAAIRVFAMIVLYGFCVFWSKAEAEFLFVLVLVAST